MRKSIGTAILAAVAAAVTALALSACVDRPTLEEIAADLNASDSFTNGVTIAEYRANPDRIAIDYGFDLPETIEVREKYELDRVAGDGDELSKTLNLLAWVADKLKHDGSVNASVPKENALNFLDYGYEKDYGMNCKQLAMTLSGCLSAVGIKSRPIFIMPKEADSGDNHVIVHVYLDALQQWIAVDPSFNASFRNADGEYLDCFALRTEIANGGEIQINEGFHYNHNYNYPREEYIAYLAKNLYWFYEIVNSKGGVLRCVPDDFDVKHWYLDYNDYLYRVNFQTEDAHRKNEEKYKNANFGKASKELFLMAE